MQSFINMMNEKYGIKMDRDDLIDIINANAPIGDVNYGGVRKYNKGVPLEDKKMKEITLNIDGKEIKATISKKEIEELINRKWPQEGDNFWWVSDESQVMYSFDFDPYDFRHKACMLMGNIYRTRQEGEYALRAQKLIAAIAKRRKELNGDWNPVDADKYFDGYCIIYSEDEYIDSESAYLNVTGSPFGIYKYSEHARTIIEEFKDDLLWFFTEYTVAVN